MIKDITKTKLYQKFTDLKLNLTDQLAAIRSLLANERTFLSYQSSALTFFVAGLTLIKFFEWEWIEIIGWILLPVGVSTGILGAYRYAKMRVIIMNLEHRVEPNSKENKK